MLMSETLHLTIRYEDGEDSRILASIPQVPGALSQGRTREEARANVLDALRLMLRVPSPASRARASALELTLAP